jgi:hypothetical protein
LGSRCGGRTGRQCHCERFFTRHNQVSLSQPSLS